MGVRRRDLGDERAKIKNKGVQTSPESDRAEDSESDPIEANETFFQEPR